MVNVNSAEVTDHKTDKSSQMVCNELEVCVVVTAFSSLKNPFTIENNTVIYCIISGISATSQVKTYLLRANTVGNELFDPCMDKRLVDTWVLSHS